MAKLHFELAPERSVCGKEDVDTTKVTDEVSCTACRETVAFAAHLDRIPDGDPSQETPR